MCILFFLLICLATDSTNNTISYYSQNTRIFYRKWNIEFGLVFDEKDIKLVKEQTERLDLISLGRGIHIGTSYVLSDMNKLLFEYSQVNSISLKDKANSSKNINLNNYTEIFIGGRLSFGSVLPYVKFLIGHQFSNYTLVVDGEAFKESQTLSLIGIAMNTSY